jgi:hypothetical protein
MYLLEYFVQDMYRTPIDQFMFHLQYLILNYFLVKIVFKLNRAAAAKFDLFLD